MNNLKVSVQNAKASYSQFMDTDYAEETANMVTQKMKQEFQTSVPSQIQGGLRNVIKLIT